MNSKLEMIFSKHCSFFDLKSYENEFKTMSAFFGQLSMERKQPLIQFLKKWENSENLMFSSNNSERIDQAKNLRQRGNDLFMAKGSQRNVLGACRLYTDAIFAALDTKSDELALSFANRGMALKTFGYYQQAYDDCVCALNFGYPESKRHKITLRQMYCSIKMEDLQRAEKHLKELESLNLNHENDIERQKLLHSLDELKQKIPEKKEEENKLNVEQNFPFKNNTEEGFIDGKGRCIQATSTINQNELLFTDRASSFLPSKNTSICYNCGKLHIIPIPCTHCRGRAIYCSLKCQQEYSVIHEYECPAYRFHFFDDYEVVHLALKTLIDNGIFSILDELDLDKKISTSQIWNDISEGGKNWKNKNLQYADVLRLISHLNKEPKHLQKLIASFSNYCVIYLNCYTNLFKVLNARNKDINWELIIASLILRHIGQNMANSLGLSIITPRSTNHMLNEKIWSSPWHLKLGCLNYFNCVNVVGIIVLPYFSLCNHSCVSHISTSFSGRSLSVYSKHNLKKGDEITTCYLQDYRYNKNKELRKKLQARYHFECQCKYCLQADIEDVNFKKFNQYRCDNGNCKQIFVPHVDQFDWWNKKCPLYCNVCGHKQSTKYYHDILASEHEMAVTNFRRSSYQKFKKLKKQFLGLNVALYLFARKLVYGWLILSTDHDLHLNEQDYRDLNDMLKYMLHFVKSDCSMNSTEYISTMACLWDLIALSKYKCSKIEMNEMLKILNMLDKELQAIFLNYYNDYIKKYF